MPVIVSVWHQHAGVLGQPPAGILSATLSKRGALMARTAGMPTDFHQVLTESYAVNERMNKLILEHLDLHA